MLGQKPETEFVALIFKKSLIKFLKSKSLLYFVWTGVEMKCNLIDGGGIQLIYGGNCTLMKIDTNQMLLNPHLLNLFYCACI